MKLQFVNYDNLDLIKSNLPNIVHKFRQDSSDWLNDELGITLFSDSKLADAPDFSLDMSNEKPPLTEAENAKRVYSSLKYLSDSQASDERLWAGLCFGPFWQYVKYRWSIDTECTENKVKQHFMFGFGSKRSLTRNAMSRLWWIGRMTYDDTRSDPWAQTRFICENADNIMHVLERNTSNNPQVVRPFLDAIIDARSKGIPINTNTMGALSKYLDLLGGIYILDCLPREKIYGKIYQQIEKMARRTSA